MEHTQWDPHNGICTMESGRWNLQDDIRTNVYQVKSLRQALKPAPSVGN